MCFIWRRQSQFSELVVDVSRKKHVSLHEQFALHTSQIKMIGVLVFVLAMGCSIFIVALVLVLVLVYLDLHWHFSSYSHLDLH